MRQVRVLSSLEGEGRAALGTPRTQEPHLPPFLLPTAACDSDHPAIIALSRRLIPPRCSAARAAAAVRTWVRANVVYALHDKSDTASATLAKCEGMCTNKANLQVALLRAAGIPAGYVLTHITREAHAGPHVLEAVLAQLSPITVHVFCAVYIPYAAPHALSAAGLSLSEAQSRALGSELGTFRHYDATERLGSNYLTEYVPYTDETRYRQRWLRGPFSPVQGNLDHLLAPGSQLPPELVAQQNALYRAHPV